MQRFIVLCFLMTAALAGACTGFERESANVLAPSPAAATNTEISSDGD